MYTDGKNLVRDHPTDQLLDGGNISKKNTNTGTRGLTSLYYLHLQIK